MSESDGCSNASTCRDKISFVKFEGSFGSMQHMEIVYPLNCCLICIRAAYSDVEAIFLVNTSRVSCFVSMTSSTPYSSHSTS